MIKKDVKQDLYVVKVLDAMRSYLHNADNNFHNSLRIGYCIGCQSIIAIGGDYTVLEGRDCNGSHYETKTHPNNCLSCNSHKSFIEISKYDMSELQERFKKKTPEIILDGIKEGLKNMRSPELYNKELLSIAKKWKRISKKEKTRQINQLLNRQKELSTTREKIKSLEETLTI